jgi:poly(3-hydroxybutyrate) depolymerase
MSSAGQAAGGSTSGGASSAGAGGSAGGGASNAKPSAGCAKGTGRPAGGAVSVPNDHYFTFPESYDGKKPFPVLFGFHGCGSGNRGTNKDDTEWMNLTKSSSFATEYVRAVPVSSSTGGCWTYGTDITRVIKAYDELLANYCVDTSRVFATGHSSGSQFLVQILTTKNKADAQHLSFKGVAPVAASDYGAMSGPIPAMYIQGKMDKERGNGDGHETVERFRAANSCSASGTSMPQTQVMGCQSGNTAVNPGCVAYDGCQAPTIWCSHNDPAYGGTMHGVPCFGVKAMFDFFKSLP